MNRPTPVRTRCHRAVAIAAALATALLAGCGTASKTATIPSEGPTMAEVYRAHTATMGAGNSRNVREQLPLRPAADPDPTPYTRTAVNEIDNRFGRIPNPDLVMFVPPHLAGPGNRYPVPGYSTVFPMYERVEYAMPGEAGSARSRTGSPAPRLTARRAQPAPAPVPATVPAPASDAALRAVFR